MYLNKKNELDSTYVKDQVNQPQVGVGQACHSMLTTNVVKWHWLLTVKMAIDLIGSHQATV